MANHTKKKFRTFSHTLGAFFLASLLAFSSVLSASGLENAQPVQEVAPETDAPLIEDIPQKEENEEEVSQEEEDGEEKASQENSSPQSPTETPLEEEEAPVADVELAAAVAPAEPRSEQQLWDSDVSWEIADNHLRIFPVNGISGTLPDITADNYTKLPWYSSRSALTNVVLEGSLAANGGLYGLFYGCSNLTSIGGLSNLDTLKATNMAYMFWRCSGLTSLDVSGFDTSQVTNMEYMFYSCWRLTSPDVSGFDTSQVTDMGDMFYNCQQITSLDMSGFDTSQVTNMKYMFFDCYGITFLDMGGFDTSRVTNMEYMFSGCSRISTLDLSGFDTSRIEPHVGSMLNMFDNCGNLTRLTLGEGFWWNGVIDTSYPPTGGGAVAHYWIAIDGPNAGDKYGINSNNAIDIPGGVAATYVHSTRSMGKPILERVSFDERGVSLKYSVFNFTEVSPVNFTQYDQIQVEYSLNEGVDWSVLNDEGKDLLGTLDGSKAALLTETQSFDISALKGNTGSPVSFRVSALKDGGSANGPSNVLTARDPFVSPDASAITNAMAEGGFFTLTSDIKASLQAPVDSLVFEYRLYGDDMFLPLGEHVFDSPQTEDISAFMYTSQEAVVLASETIYEFRALADSPRGKTESAVQAFKFVDGIPIIKDIEFTDNSLLVFDCRIYNNTYRQSFVPYNGFFVQYSTTPDSENSWKYLEEEPVAFESLSSVDHEELEGTYRKDISEILTSDELRDPDIALSFRIIACRAGEDTKSLPSSSCSIRTPGVLQAHVLATFSFAVRSDGSVIMPDDNFCYLENTGTVPLKIEGIKASQNALTLFDAETPWELIAPGGLGDTVLLWNGVFTKVGGEGTLHENDRTLDRGKLLPLLWRAQAGSEDMFKELYTKLYEDYSEGEDVLYGNIAYTIGRTS